MLAYGCGGISTPKPASIEGVVTIGGKPLTTGYIQFLSKSTPNVEAALLKEDGSYQVAGLSLGEYDVQIGPPVVPPGSPPPPSGQTIPKKYMDPSTSGLKVTVKPGKNRFDPVLE